MSEQELAPNEYRCAICHQIYMDKRLEGDSEDRILICDNCWPKMHPEMHPEMHPIEYAALVREKKDKKMPEQEPKEVSQIYGGKWAAYGNGWAVHGDTQEEAIENFHKAAKRHEEILAMPPWYTLTPEEKAEANKQSEE